jgi:hypothetical protein
MTIPTPSITTLEDLVRHYFSDWEINAARSVPDPAAMLISFAARSQRGLASPAGYHWQTQHQRIEAWFNHRPWSERPDVSISLPAFARRVVDVLINGADQLRMEI